MVLKESTRSWLLSGILGGLVLVTGVLIGLLSSPESANVVQLSQSPDAVAEAARPTPFPPANPNTATHHDVSSADKQESAPAVGSPRPKAHRAERVEAGRRPVMADGSAHRQSARYKSGAGLTAAAGSSSPVASTGSAARPMRSSTPDQQTFTVGGGSLASPENSPGTSGSAPAVVKLQEPPDGQAASVSSSFSSPSGNLPLPPRDPEPTGTPMVTAVAMPGTAAIGDAIAIEVRIAAAQDVGHVPFSLGYEPAVLRFDQGQEGRFLRSDGNQTVFFASPSSSGGMVVVGLSRLGNDPGVDGSGPLCTLQFTAIGSGDAALAFSRAKIRDSQSRVVPAAFSTASLVVRGAGG